MHRRFVDGLEGFETVATATTGEEVVPIVRERKIDLVLLDVYLPDISGLEVLGRLRASQAEVDSLLGRSAEAPAPSSLPKGLSGPTFQLVSKTLREAGADMAASEVSASCGISRVSSRRYLEYLVSRGLAELRPRYGATGRPEHRYRWLR